MGNEARVADWTFLTNHSHVLLCLAHDPDQPLREVALQVGITERSAQRIVTDLEKAGVIERFRIGRSNRYRVNAQSRLRHPIERHCRVEQLLAMVLGPEKRRGGAVDRR